MATLKKATRQERVMAPVQKGAGRAKTRWSEKAAGRRKTVAEIIEARRSELLEAWQRNIRDHAGTPTLELMTEGQLQGEATKA